MRTSPVMLGLIGLLVALSGYLYLALRTSREQLAAARTEIASVRRQLLESAVTKVQRPERPAADVAPELPVFEKNAAVNGALARWVQVLNRPDAADLMADQQRASVSARYGAFLKSLALPPEKLERVKSLLVDREMAFNEAASVSLKQGVNPLDDVSGFQQLVATSKDQVDQQLRSELGEQGYAQYADFQNSQGIRMVLNDVSAAMESDHPLTPEQRALLEQTMATTGNDSDSAAAAAGGTPKNRDGVITERTLQQAAAFLSPGQLAVLGEQRRAQIAKWKLQQMFSVAGP